jgi:hypothetical protein
MAPALRGFTATDAISDRLVPRGGQRSVGFPEPTKISGGETPARAIKSQRMTRL